jgi:hypothetical protein
VLVLGLPPEVTGKPVQLFVLKLQAKKNELEIDYQNKTKGAPAHSYIHIVLIAIYVKRKKIKKNYFIVDIIYSNDYYIIY